MLETKLKGMIGHTYMVNGHYYKVQSYQLDTDGQLTIAADKKWFTAEADQVKKLLKQFLPVALDNREVELTLMPAKNEMRQIKNIVMDNIKKVQDDAKYIPQATAVNQSVNTLLNMAKLELQAAKLAREV